MFSESSSQPPESFPTVRWGDRSVTFVASSPPPYSEPLAVVLFLWHRNGWLVADIPGRGWCVPSGHLVPGETPLEAALRETWEEVGVQLETAREIGYYASEEPDGGITIVPAFAAASESTPSTLPSSSESRGAYVMNPSELPDRYWRWDELVGAVFTHARRSLVSSCAAE